MGIEFYFANKIENLATQFLQNLNADKRTKNPFYSPMVVVPNMNLLKWLQMEIAKNNSIYMNIGFDFLENVITKALSKLSSTKYDNYIFLGHKINHIELQLLIIYVIHNNNFIELAKIKEYLGDENQSKDYTKKLWQISFKIASYFREYEYQRENMLKLWANDKLINPDSKMENAQKKIYFEIFSDNGLLNKLNDKLEKENSFFNRKFTTLPNYSDIVFEEIEKEQKDFTEKEFIYIFGFSQISLVHYKLLVKLSKYYQIKIYQLNFLYDFWATEDDSKKWQNISNLKEKDIVYPNDNENPLIKLWAKPSYENLKLISKLIYKNDNFEIKSFWIKNEKQKLQNSSLLNILQSNISHNNLFDMQVQKAIQDKSIQIVGCPSIHREIETVYNSIIYNMETNKDIKLTDIAVLVPNMEKYKTVIKSIFLKNPIDSDKFEINSKILIPFNLSDSTASFDSSFGKALIKMLELAKGFFTRKDAFELFLNPCFITANNLVREDILVWLEWISKLNVFYGFDENKIDFYSWGLALKRLKFGRIMDSVDDFSCEKDLFYQNIVPFSDIESEDIEKLDKFVNIIESLFIKLKFLKDKKENGEFWAYEIKNLINDFLLIPDDLKAENYVLHQILLDLERLKTYDFISNQKIFNVSYIIEFIKANLSEIPSGIGSYLCGGVTISSLAPLRPIPFKIVYIVGLTEGDFPGFKETSTLDLRTEKREIGDIERSDANKYLFLETLMSVREKLYLTYICKDIQKDQEFLPCSIILQLKDYINSNILINGQFEESEAPLKGNSKFYFKKQVEFSDIFVNYSFCERLLTLIDIKEKYKHIFNDEQIKLIEERYNNLKNKEIIQIEDKKEDNEINKIKLNELLEFLLDPLQFLLKKYHNIEDEENEDEKIKEDEPFYSKFPYDYKLITKTLDHYVCTNDQKESYSFFNKYYEFSKLESKTPVNEFGEIDKNYFKDFIIDRIDKGSNLSNFLNKMIINNYFFYEKINLGYKEKNDEVLNFKEIDFDYDGKIIKLLGSLSYIWKKDNQIETLVITNSKYKEGLTKYIFKPFLFYIFLLNEDENSNSFHFVKDCDFIINISYKSDDNNNDFKTFKYKIDINEAKQYLFMLIRDFIKKEYDYLPFDIISDIINKNKQIITEDVINREIIEQKILDDENNDFNKEEGLSIFDIIKKTVPDDCFTKIYNRFNITRISITPIGTD